MTEDTSKHLETRINAILSILENLNTRYEATIERVQELEHEVAVQRKIVERRHVHVPYLS